jgi:DNA-binding IclR family transcriptional regulator
MPLHIGAAPRVLMAYLSEERVDEIIKRKGLGAWTNKSISKPKFLKEDLQKIRSQRYALSMGDVTVGAAARGCPVFN